MRNNNGLFHDRQATLRREDDRQGKDAAMKKDKKRIELLLLMGAAGLIDVPTKANTFAMKAMKKRGLDDKVKLIDAITDHQYGRSKLLMEPSIGPVTVAEMCWWAVYGKDETPNAELRPPPALSQGD